MRTALLLVTLLFVLALLALTLHAVASGGVDILTVLSGLVLALLGFGVVGALLHPPPR
ncbi:MAG: hypothetical protein QOI62_3071 [Solirubrobacteraceae bacterium]|jgi:hypothetical protein|nr:hypothetical protein [Solirubrobacteraceae bacterium]